MKFRLSALAILLCMFLGACSLAEDITPPPGYTQPASAPTLEPITPTAVVAFNCSASNCHGYDHS